jgi:hypothetical protein
MSSRVSGVVSVINVWGTPLSDSVEVIFTPGVVSVINVGTPLKIALKSKPRSRLRDQRCVPQRRATGRATKCASCGSCIITPVDSLFSQLRSSHVLGASTVRIVKDPKMSIKTRLGRSCYFSNIAHHSNIAFRQYCAPQYSSKSQRQNHLGRIQS